MKGYAIFSLVKYALGNFEQCTAIKQDGEQCTRRVYVIDDAPELCCTHYKMHAYGKDYYKGRGQGRRQKGQSKHESE